MKENREDLLMQLWRAQDEAYELMNEYDMLPHRYGEMALFQAETHIIDLIAVNRDITITDLAGILKKTPSACSQIVRKLRTKGLVEQLRDADNNRVYHLRLTGEGERIYQDHAQFEAECRQRTFDLLADLSCEELAAGLSVQRRLNQAYTEDVRRSREHYI